MLSANRLSQLPEDTGIEVAFAGRSNTGKSSVINVLTRQRQLARVSKTPGRTQLLNCFEIAADRRLIDLPGYGFARVPESIKRHWGQVLEQYFQNRAALKGLVLIVDIRHGLKPHDWQMQEWCVANRLSMHIVLNKADKLSRGAAMNEMNKLQQEIDSSATLQIFSALKKTGVEPLIEKLDDWFGWTD